VRDYNENEAQLDDEAKKLRDVRAYASHTPEVSVQFFHGPHRQLVRVHVHNI